MKLQDLEWFRGWIMNIFSLQVNTFSCLRHFTKFVCTNIYFTFSKHKSFTEQKFPKRCLEVFESHIDSSYHSIHLSLSLFFTHRRSQLNSVNRVTDGSLKNPEWRQCFSVRHGSAIVSGYRRSARRSLEARWRHRWPLWELYPSCLLSITRSRRISEPYQICCCHLITRK